MSREEPGETGKTGKEGAWKNGEWSLPRSSHEVDLLLGEVGVAVRGHLRGQNIKCLNHTMLRSSDFILNVAGSTEGIQAGEENNKRCVSEKKCGAVL